MEVYVQIQPKQPITFMLTDAHTHKHVHVGPNTFTVTLFGNKHGHDWSLAQLADNERSREYRDRLNDVHRALNLGYAYVVDATEFNTRILQPSDFTVRTLSGHRFLQAPGLPAEGMSLRVGEAGVQSPAGCLTIVMARYNSFGSRRFDPIKAHAGRWSLVARRGVDRTHESVCHAMLERLDVGTPHEAQDVWVKLLWGIRGEEFPHTLNTSEHAETNTWLWQYLGKSGWRKGTSCVDGIMYLDLAMIAKAQLMQRGVPEAHINLDDAYLPSLGVYKDGGRGKPRNLVVVKRLS